MTSAQLSSTGKRVLVTARGEVFTLPIKDGSPRNLTVRRFPAVGTKNES